MCNIEVVYEWEIENIENINNLVKEELDKHEWVNVEGPAW